MRRFAQGAGEPHRLFITRVLQMPCHWLEWGLTVWEASC